MEKRLGCVSIILDRREASVPQVNELVSQFGDCIVGRLGLPYPARGVSIITLITDSTVDRLSALTGKLGKLPGVQVKSLMSKVPETGVPGHVDPSEHGGVE